MSKDKVLFNLKNAHYAVLTDGEGGVVSFGTPVAIPGSVSLALDPEGESNVFYADGIAYYVTQGNNGYSGDYECAMIPEQMLTDVWGMEKDEQGLIVENVNAKQKSFALLFEVDGDTTGRKYVLYNCSAARPNIEAETATDTKEPKTQTVTITVSPLASGVIKAHTSDTATADVTGKWYEAVTMPKEAAE